MSGLAVRRRVAVYLADSFDPAAIAALLTRAMSRDAAAVPLNDARVERCWPAKGGLRFEWSARVGRGRRIAAFGAYQDGEPLGADSPGRLTPAGWRGLSRQFPERDLLVHSPDRDAKMPHLAECLDAESMIGALGALLRGRSKAPPRADSFRAKLLGYKPARRAALRYEWSQGGRTRRVMGKTFRDDRGERLVELHESVGRQLRERSDGRLRVPEALAYLPERRMALFEWVPGRSIDDTGRLSQGALDAAVDALATLHDVAVPGLPTFSRTDELAIVQRWLRTLRLVNGGAASRGERLAERLERLEQRLAPPAVATIHRDFYEKQLISHAGRTTLLDLDTLARGEPAQDLGNLLSHLYLRGLSGPRLRYAGRGAHADALLKRYARRRGAADSRAVAFYAASSLIRGGALHALRSASAQHSAALWTEAQRILNEVS